jgi:hypothetical protein
MSPTLAMWIVTWVAIVVLFLAVGAVLREVRLLRVLITRDSGFSATAPDLRLDPGVVEGRDNIVLASDSGCPLCAAVASRLAARAVEDGARPVLLTYEEPASWPDEIRSVFNVVSDQSAWQAIAHLSPPVLMAVAGDGTVRQLGLPVDESTAEQMLDKWIPMTNWKGALHGSHVGADSAGR